MKILNDKKYIVGRNNLAITIFVPYDCPNHCPFCTSKSDYKDMGDFSLPNILESLDKVLVFPQIRDVVITGGEPFADLEKLGIILNALIGKGKHVYINTTLPIAREGDLEAIYKFIKDHKDIINGLNISRHMLITTNYENDYLIQLIHNTLPNISLRINSVLLDLKSETNRVNDFIDKYASMVNSISFRGDYTKIVDQNTLRGLDHPILDVLFNEDKLVYLGSGGCLVCNNNDFYYPKTNTYVSLHRGYEHSAVKKGKNYILNDIIIKQDGKVLSDWDGELLDIKLLKYQWLLNYNERY